MQKFVIAEVDPELHRAVKVACAALGVTVTAVVQEALKAFVDAVRARRVGNSLKASVAFEVERKQDDGTG